MKSLQTIATSIAKKCEKMLVKEIPNCRKWNELQSVGDQSSFVKSMNNLLMHDVSIVHRLIAMQYQQYFNTNFVSNLIPRYVGAIFKCRFAKTLYV